MVHHSLRAGLLVAATAFLGALILPASSRGAQDINPATRSNLGGGLNHLAQWYESNRQTGGDRRWQLRTEAPITNRARVDAAVTQAVVDVRLNGVRSVAMVRSALESFGLKVLAVRDVAGPGSIISAWLPLRNVDAARRVPGVHSISLVHKPIRRAGKALTQGAGILSTPLLNGAGLTGTGITIGVVSDSYNLTQPAASKDVESGDLPGAGNPAGKTTPVMVLAEGNPADATDEGRAMLQIIHDIAPDAKLVFASCGESSSVFAQRIFDLRTVGQCDIIVDDIGFPDEPFFSDGGVSQVVDTVVHSTTAAGKKVLYYSAAGNDGDQAFQDDFRMVTALDVKDRVVKSNLRLTNVPAYLYAGGFHNFDKTGSATKVVTQHVIVTGDFADLVLQWDDPFLPGFVTTDYNILIFDNLGNYRAALSGTDDNINIGAPLEFVDLPPGRYQLAIARRDVGSQVLPLNPNSAVHLKYLVSTGGNYQSDFFPPNAPTIFGHPAAPGADGVAAYDYKHLDHPESYSSFGPVTIYLDRNGARLATPEVRMAPTIAAPDGVDTTFFPPGPLAFTDSDKSGFPNFFGTSAAAPHAAAVAALLLQAGGGPGTVSETDMRSYLQGSSAGHDLDPNFAKAVATSTDGMAAVTITATGDDSNNSSFDTKFFKVTFNDSMSRSVRQIQINMQPAGLRFDPSATLGLPFRVGAVAGLLPANVRPVFGGVSRTILSLNITPGAFVSGESFSFGVDRDDLKLGSGGNQADLLGGATVNFLLLDGSMVRTTGGGIFQNVIGKGYSPADGFGLIDAQAARDLMGP